MIVVQLMNNKKRYVFYISFSMLYVIINMFWRDQFTLLRMREPQP